MRWLEGSRRTRRHPRGEMRSHERAGRSHSQDVAEGVVLALDDHRDGVRHLGIRGECHPEIEGRLGANRQQMGPLGCENGKKRSGERAVAGAQWRARRSRFPDLSLARALLNTVVIWQAPAVEVVGLVHVGTLAALDAAPVLQLTRGLLDDQLCLPWRCSTAQQHHASVTYKV